MELIEGSEDVVVPCGVVGFFNIKRNAQGILVETETDWTRYQR